MIINRIIYSILYRLNKINSILIKGKNNIIDKHKIIGCKVEIIGNNNKIVIGPNSLIKDTFIYIKGNDILLKIGNYVSIKGGELWLEDNNTMIKIGNKTTIEKAHIAVTESDSKIIIGEDCMLAKEIEIRTGDSHSIIDNAGKRINFAKSVEIGNHVWIGNAVKILKGVKIADNCIIGTGSIVTSEINKQNTMIVGVPAKIVKENINWTRERLS